MKVSRRDNILRVTRPVCFLASRYQLCAEHYTIIVSVVPNPSGSRSSEQAPGSIGRTHSLLATDIDGTLVLEGSRQPGLEELKAVLAARSGSFLFAVATGRDIHQIRQIIDDYGIPYPDVVVSDVGTQIRYGLTAERDTSWTAHLNSRWSPRHVMALLCNVRGLRLQEPERQGHFKISFYVQPGFDRQALDAAIAECRGEINV